MIRIHGEHLLNRIRGQVMKLSPAMPHGDGGLVAAAAPPTGYAVTAA